MYALVFYICISPVDCSVQAVDAPFYTEDQCKIVAMDIINTNNMRQLSGELPTHTAQYACVNFGDSA